jgi:hypothetical protein
MEAMVLLGRLLQVSSGILAVQDPTWPVEPARALAYARAALVASAERGIDVWELIGLARDETSFRHHLVGPDGKDCGITQTRITVSRYSCHTLRSSYAIGFREGARELRGYADSCRGRKDFDRCRFNRYNSGIRYAKHGHPGRYWLRVMCYAEAARVGGDGHGCARVHTRREIALARGGPLTASR